MQQDIEVVPKIQRSSNYHQKRETVTHLNPEEGYLQAAPTGGRTNPNTGTAGKYWRVPQKKRDELLVETDIICYFRGLILCNAKRLQFHRNKKGQRKGTVQRFFYVLTSYFF